MTFSFLSMVFNFSLLSSIFPHRFPSLVIYSFPSGPLAILSEYSIQLLSKHQRKIDFGYPVIQFFCQAHKPATNDVNMIEKLSSPVRRHILIWPHLVPHIGHEWPGWDLLLRNLLLCWDCLQILLIFKACLQKSLPHPPVLLHLSACQLTVGTYLKAWMAHRFGYWDNKDKKSKEH